MVISRNAGTYDTYTGKVSVSTDDDQFDGWARIGNYSDRLIDGKVIEANDRRVTLIPDEEDFTIPSYVPQVGDVINVDDSTDGNYKVVNFKTRELGAELICYTLQVRNA